jgi:hypothetical protein
MLQEEVNHVFSGMTFWDQDYYYGEPIPSILDLISEVTLSESQLPLRSFFPMPNIDPGSGPSRTVAPPGGSIPPSVVPKLNYRSFINIYQTAYDEHQSLFRQLLGHLHFRPTSKIHLPLSSMVASLGQNIELDKLTRGCEHIVFRSFYVYPNFPKEEMNNLIRARAANPEMLGLGDRQFVRWFNMFEEHREESCHQSWVMGGLMQTNTQRLFLFVRNPPKIDATHIEIRHYGQRGVPRARSSMIENGRVWPDMNDRGFTNHFLLFFIMLPEKRPRLIANSVQHN